LAAYSRKAWNLRSWEAGKPKTSIGRGYAWMHTDKKIKI
jgi:hypothetical protein